MATETDSQNGENLKDEDVPEYSDDSMTEDNSDEPRPEYSSNTFLVLKDDLPVELFPIWRIDGKTLLQKYLPFKNASGALLHKSSPMYAYWSETVKVNYLPVRTVLKSEERTEIVVQCIKPEVKKEDTEFKGEKEKCD